jgi:hypothetical protein
MIRLYSRMVACLFLSLALALSPAFGVGIAWAGPLDPVDPPTVTATLAPGNSIIVTKTVHTPEIPPKPDLIFLADTTGSMGPALANVQINATDIMNMVRAAQLDSQFGAANYKDFDCAIDPFPYKLDQAITASITTAQAGINTWFTVGGSGCLTPEAQLNALYQLATDPATGWRPGSTRIIAWFGDSSGNDPSNGHTITDVITALNNTQIRVIAVPVDTAPDGDGLDSTGQASAITAATGGVLLPTSTTSNEVSDAILAGLQNLPVTVTPELGTCDPNLTVSWTPASQTVTSGTDATFSETITVSAGAPQGTTIDCTVNFLLDGRVVDGFTESIHITTPPSGLCTILDDFNRPDGPLGSNWDGRTSGYRIISNEVAVRAGGPIYWQPDAYGADQEACVTLTRINPKSKQHALLLKVQELNDWRQGAILVSYNARSGNVEVEARDVSNNQWVLVGSLTPSTPVVDGDQLRAQALADGTVEVFINITSLGTADAGSFYADKGGQIGLWFRGGQGDDDDDEDNNEDNDRLVQARENDGDGDKDGDGEHNGEEDDDGDGPSAAHRALLDDFGGGTIAPPALSCLDIQALTPFPQTFPGPMFSLAPLDFTNPIDPSGMSLSIDLTDRPEDLDGKPELSVGFSSDVGGYQPLFAEFPSTTFPTGVKDVTVELMHFNSATVLALDNGGAVVGTATQPTQNMRASLLLTGSGIRKLQFNVVETLLYKICWVP